MRKMIGLVVIAVLLGGIRLRGPVAGGACGTDQVEAAERAPRRGPSN